MCARGDDADCRGTGWLKARPMIVFNSPTGACVTQNVFNVEAGGSYVFTACRDPADTAIPGPTGNPRLGRVTDIRTGGVLSIPELAFGNDCTSPTAAPNIARWDCRTSTGADQAFCSGNNTGGFIMPTISANGPISVEMCAEDGKPFSAYLYILYNHAIGGEPNGG